MPWTVVSENNQYCVYKLDADGKPTGDSLHCYDNEGEAEKYKKALYANSEMTGGEFSFTELSASDLKAIDGLAAGTFMSMSGEEVTFKPSELQAYIDNTNKIIESTKTESGEIIGLPIDKNRHDHDGGAGWIVGLELDAARNIIKFLVNWTEEGINLISKKIRLFFSPSVDNENKLILGGSLTNNPATRSDDGLYLLRPIELSKSIKEIDMEKTLLDILTELPGKVAEAIRGGNNQPPVEKPAAPVAPVVELQSATIKELLNTPEAIEELGKRAEEKARETINAEKRKMHAVEFAASIVGGTKEKPFGLPVRSGELVALLLSLPEKQAMAVEKILAKALDSAIDFAEHGYDSEGFIHRPNLSADLAKSAREWVKAGRSIESFFEANPEIGKAEDYNLREFVKGDK